MVDESPEKTEWDDVFTTSGDFDYYQPEDFNGAPPRLFDPKKLGDYSVTVYHTVRALGYRWCRVRYDGGNDEGGAEAVSMTTADGETHTMPVVVERLNEAGIADELQAVNNRNRKNNPDGLYADANFDLLPGAIYGIAIQTALSLFVNGFGTGSYSIYGECTVDFETGEVQDHLDVQPPPPPKPYVDEKPDEA